ncbi:hypothetical protein QUB80_07725 [Chlorogloeopsis sp. ULAP01]|uniref:hypothetical protein n=1 Tax=Chlorogloeopsis sp. ULAP01 TaxID=3056483 RepID=UPI0025AB1378|nr:hypothetical protein [Chlorogloeopsis sp. ULAP01]MDM9380593.1 hypothetical protein [Chlorogloeopsis sp. ULAP01]
MRVWLACFLVLFALAQLFDWIEELKLPLPIYILGGAFLAVASNYDKLFGAYFGDITDASIEAQLEHQQLNLSPQSTASVSLPEPEVKE